MLKSFLRPSDAFEIEQVSLLARRLAEQELRVERASKPQFERKHFSKMGALGLTRLNLAEEFSGAGLPSLAVASALFEMSRAQLGPAIYLSVHLMVGKLIASRSRDRKPLLEALGSGEKLGAFCLTEAEAGSDAAHLSTQAKKTSSGYVLSGEKIYITSAGEADVYLVFARTAKTEAKGISAFVVEKGANGMSFGPPEKKMGCEGSPIASVHFENTEIPETARLGEEGEGYKIALSGLSGGRVNIAACACGLSSRAIELATAHLKTRKQFGQKLAEFQGLQFMLADMISLYEASVLLTRNAAEALDTNSQANAEASIAKCFATDAAMKITTDAVQLLGGSGYLAEYEVERLMRDAKMLQIVEGTNQIQRILIAREALA